MKSLISIVFPLLITNSVQAGPTAEPTALVECSLPDADGVYQTVNASQVNVDQAIANQAIADASGNGVVSIKIFRNNCLFASSQAIDPSVKTDGIQKNLFSATKGVISILTGIAYDRGLLNLDDAIDKYLPLSVFNSWGDAAHRAITIRQLLTETAGTAKGVVSEALTVLLDESIPQEALAQPLINTPGTVFAYSQRVPDLLAYVVSRAVNQELQAFAQQNLFTPVGIPQDRYVWFRDRSFNSYGYAWLYMNPDDFARLGLFMQNGGAWNGVRVLSEDYVNQVSVPSPTNGCYGLLFWTNQVSPTSPGNDTCISPSGYFFNRSWFPSAPRDLYAMAGSPQQKNYIIPSLNMTVSWMSVLTDMGPKDDTYYQFFKALMPSILDPGFVIPGPGTYETEPFSLSTTLEAVALEVLLADVLASPSCNILFCNNSLHLQGLLGNLGQLLDSILVGVDGLLSSLFASLTGA